MRIYYLFLACCNVVGSAISIGFTFMYTLLSSGKQECVWHSINIWYVLGYKGTISERPLWVNICFEYYHFYDTFFWHNTQWQKNRQSLRMIKWKLIHLELVGFVRTIHVRDQIQIIRPGIIVYTRINLVRRILNSPSSSMILVGYSQFYFKYQYVSGLSTYH